MLVLYLVVVNHVKPFLSEHLISISYREGIRKQFVFDFDELRDSGSDDPLNEASFSPTRGLVRRYPDRVVLTITSRCFAYCRFCFRKRNWNRFEGFDLNAAVRYISSNREIREVLISGGDPLTLENRSLDRILSALKKIEHLRFFRLGTRAPTAFPERVDAGLIATLKPYKPVWIAIHVNHPDEITGGFKKAVGLFVDNGFPVISQTVLLRSINDDSYTLKKLFCGLVELGVKPYYLLGCDPAKGNEQFRVPLKKALGLMSDLRGHVSGLCVPTFAFDLPGGGGKVVVEPNSMRELKENGVYIFENFEGDLYEYEEF